MFARTCCLNIVAGLILLYGAGCVARHPYVPPPLTPIPSEQIEQQKGVYHEVQKGQTLWRIAKEYSVDINELARVNRIRDYTYLRVGQLLFIPGVETIKSVRVRKDPAQFPKVQTEKNFFRPLRSGQVDIGFGQPKGRVRNKGVDFKAETGADVLAAKTGVVTFSDQNMRGLGRVLVIDHQDEYITVYAHLSEALVKEGAVVRRGQAIGVIGTSGRIQDPALHFEVRKNGKAIDPLKVLPRY